MNFVEPDISRSILQEIHIDILNKDGNRLFVKRDDLIHEIISGNKWRKLKYNIKKATNDAYDGIITFGGAYSNHLVAAAAAAKINGLKSVGVVRGEELHPESNETLSTCLKLGMQLDFVSREEYTKKNERFFLDKLAVKYSNMLIIPEGGAGYLGMIGCQEILHEVDVKFDIAIVAQGTSTTAAGLLLSLSKQNKLWGVPVLKGYKGASEIASLYQKCGFDGEASSEFLDGYVQLSDYHFGGYSKYTNELLDLIALFWSEYQLRLDPVYTGKVMAAMLGEVKKRGIQETNFLFIHTGGLQGSKSIFSKEKREIY